MVAAKDTKPHRPNIVLILADDMGFSDIGCYGGEVQTPNLDQLAAEGIRYTQFYNATRCCPTRASLLTGLYPHNAGIGYMCSEDRGKPGYHASLNNQCVTLAEAMKQAGYRTYMAGKWHVAQNFEPDGPKDQWPLQRGFDKFYGTLVAAGSYWNPITLMDGNKPAKPSGDFYYTEVLADKSIEYIRDAGDQPFFLYLAFTAPHWPLHARQQIIEKYRGRFTAGYDQLRRQRYNRLINLGIIDPNWELSPRDPEVPAWENLENKAWQESRMGAYAATIDHLDQAVGRVVEELQKRGELDNTVIFFLSDNGGDEQEHPDGLIGHAGSTSGPWARMRYVPLYTRDSRPVIAGDIPGVELGPDTTYGGRGRAWANLSNAPFKWYKQYTHEGGISTPLIVRWPDRIKAKGELRRQVGHVIDIMPTCLEIAGTKYPNKLSGEERTPLNGVSLIPTFDNHSLPHRTLFWEHSDHRAFRGERWKLVAATGKPWELYDMKADRTETRNLASQHPQIVKQMAREYDEWAKKNNVLPWESLQIPFVTRGSLTRTDEEMQEYYDTLLKLGINPPFLKDK